MPIAEIITIGTEILLGEIVDTNARYIARALRDVGIDLYRKTTVGDNSHRIAQAIQQAMQKSDIILTTGGLGPTVDDPTRQAVAQALETELEFREELWEQIRSRFKRFGRMPTENNKRQAFIPFGAQAIENQVGTAPAFYIEKGGVLIISLPGVPREMEFLMEKEVLPRLIAWYNLTGLIKARLLHTVGAGESQIDDLIGDLETLSNPTVGLAAHSGQVDVRITAKASSEAEADRMIQAVEEQIRLRLGEWIYGADTETLEEAALKSLDRRGWTLVVVEYGIGGRLIKRLSENNAAIPQRLQALIKGGELINSLENPNELGHLVTEYRDRKKADCGLGAAVFYGDEKQEIQLVLETPIGEKNFAYPFGGPPEYAARYAIHNSLDILRRLDKLGISNQTKMAGDINEKN
jgi:nicotinamide-nucleotide amidase